MTPTYFPRLVGQSAWMTETLERIEQVAPFRANVLVSGPSGTGKELVARAIHDASRCASGPFLPVNCAAIPHSLFDSQMFGHIKGAFTGAEYESLGCFRAATGGTLFLDEIGELDLDLQAKLLRVLQDRHVTPLGSQTPQPIDVRIVAATNRDLEKEVAEGRFRLDLYYRLNVIEIPTIALAERVEDIEVLSSFLLHKACVENGVAAKTITSAAMMQLVRYNWPGNVRELQNLMERAALACPGDQLDVDSLEMVWNRKALPPADSMALPPRPGPQSRDVSAESEWKSLDDVEAEHIARTLERVDLNKSAAARLLKIDRKRLDRKIEKYQLLRHVGPHTMQSTGI